MQSNTSVFRGLALLGALALGITACEPKTEVILPDNPAEIVLADGSIELRVGETRQIAASVRGLSAGQSQGVTCTLASSNPANAVAVTSGCLVTANAVGSGLVTVTSQADASVSAQVAVNVIAGPGAGQVTITLTPSNVPNLPVGDSVIIVANVSGGAANLNREVTFTSTDPSRATVSRIAGTNNAVVRGVSPGTAVITARVMGDTTAVATATVTVGGAGAGTGAISFGVITQVSTNLPINPAGVAGPINVTLNVTPGSADSLQVALVFTDTTGGTPVEREEIIESCSRTFGGTSDQQQTITCTINTTQLDEENQPLFRNGQYRIVARLIDNGQVVVSAQTEQITFANVDILFGTVQVDTFALDPTGLRWNGGDITFTVSPVIFSTNQGEIASVTLSMSGFYQGEPVTVTAQDTDASDGFMLTFDASALPTQAANGILEFNTGVNPGAAGGNLTISSVTAGGQQGPGDLNFFFGDLQSGTAIVNNEIRVDNQSPLSDENPTDDDARQLAALTLPQPAGADIQGGFINATSRFISGFFVSTFATPGDPNTGVLGPAGRVPDDAPYGTEGIDAVTVEFAAVRAGFVQVAFDDPNTAAVEAENERLFGIGTRVTRGGELAGTTEPTAFVLVARVTDRLGNSDYIRLVRPNTLGQFVETFGVDLFAPVVSFSTAAAPNGSIGDTAIIRNATDTSFVVSFSDASATEEQGGPSGFGATPVRVQLTRYDATATGGRCYQPDPAGGGDPDADGAYEFVPSLAGQPSRPNCAFYNTDGIVDVPAEQGYYILRAFTVDRAGNASADTIRRIVLRDNQAPTVTVSGFSLLTNQLRFSGTLSDNVDLDAFDIRLQFSGGGVVIEAPVSLFSDLGEFGPPVNVSQPVDQLTALIRSLTVAGAGGAPGAVLPITGGGFGALDESGLFTVGTFGVTAPLGDGIDTINGQPSQIQSFAIMQPAAAITVCNNAPRTGCAANTPLTVRLAAVATGPTNTFQRPFTRVDFHAFNPVYGALVLIASTTNAIATEVTAPTTARTWTYQIDWNSISWPVIDDNNDGTPDAPTQIFAVGIAADGDAFLTQPNTFVTVDGIRYVVPIGVQ